MNRKKPIDHLYSNMIDISVPELTEEQTALAREHAERWAVDDAEYETFSGMLFGDEPK